MNKKCISSVFAVAMLFGMALLTTPTTHAASVVVNSSTTLPSNTEYRMVGYTASDSSEYMVVAAGTDGVLVYAVGSDGIATSPSATINTPGTAVDVVVSGSNLIIADRYTGQGLSSIGHVYIYSLATPSQPQLLATYSDSLADFQAVAVTEDGQTLFAADRIAGVSSISIADPTAPTHLDTYNAGTSAVDLEISSNMLYILQSVGEFGYVHLVDITDPSNFPSYTSLATVNSSANELLADGEKLYVSNGDTGLTIYDYSNPSTPVATGAYNSSGAALSFSLVGSGYGVLADGSNGIVVTSMMNSVNPTPIATENTQMTAAIDTVVFGDRIFVLSNGIYEMNIKLNLTVTGSDNGKKEKVTVKENGILWCVINVSSSEVGAQAFVADIDGDGLNHEIVEAPKGKIKKPKLRVFDGSSCNLVTSKAMSDSDSAVKFKIKTGNYYGDSTSKDEIVAARAYNKDGVAKLKLLAYFYKDATLKKKTANTFDSLQTFVDDGFKIKISEGKDYPIRIEAKSDSDIKEKYQLKKTDDGYKFKRKDS